MCVRVYSLFNWFICILLVSEPSLKMRSSKLSLRQKVIQRNSQLMRKREVYRQRIPAACECHFLSDFWSFLKIESEGIILNDGYGK